MKIVKCRKCGSIYLDTAICWHCGKEAELDTEYTKTIPDNALSGYEQVIKLIADKQFDNAYTLSESLLEWAPDCSDIYWVRVMASHQFSSLGAILKEGISYQDDADLFNAVQFAEGNSKEAYKTLCKFLDNIKGNLVDALVKHSIQEKAASDIFSVHENMQRIVNNKKKELFSLWSELETVEHKMYAIEKDCEQLMYEYKSDVDSAFDYISTTRSQINRFSEYEEDALHSFQVKLGTALKQSDLAVSNIQHIQKNHQWVSQYETLVSKQTKIYERINTAIRDLQEYNAKIQRVLNKVNEIDKEHDDAIHQTENYDFRMAEKLLGKKEFDNVLCNAGLSYDFIETES